NDVLMLMFSVRLLHFIAGVFADSIGPNDKDTNVIIREGESVTLRCSYDASSSYVYIYWYRQYPNSEPEYLLWKGARSYEGEHKIEQRFQPTSSQSSTELIINSVTLSDSALYYCALRVDAQ
ncbi:T-cell receptor alpha chain V region RL-5, partial [Anabarilius grahami]